METRKLGPSGIDVPIITLGTMNWGQQNDESQAHEQLDYAVDERGLYFIDTAEIYPIPPEPQLFGDTERFIGSWLKKRGKRDDLVIASKVAPTNMAGGSRTGKLDKKNINEAIDGTLERLGVDYIDLYQVHWPERPTNFFGTRGFSGKQDDNSTPIEETLEALGELIKDGKIKHIGVSNETPWGVMQYLNLADQKGLPRIVSIQNQYSLMNRTFEIGLSEMIMKENIAMLVYSALSFGVLSGKYLGGARPEGARFTLYERNAARYNPTSEHGIKGLTRYVELAKDNGLDPSMMAIAFAHMQKFVTSVIIGATNLDQLKDDIDAHELVLSDEILNEIEKIHDEFPDIHS